MGTGTGRGSVAAAAMMAAAFASGLAARAPDDAEAARPIAVVDVFRVLRDAPCFDAEEQAVNAWIEEERRPLEALQETIRRLEAELAVFERTAPEYEERRFRLEQAKLEFDHEFRVRDQRRVERIAESRLRAFDRVREAVREVAAAEGIALVLQVRGEPLQARTTAEVTSEIMVRDVLHHAPEIDLTDAVLARLGT